MKIYLCFILFAMLLLFSCKKNSNQISKNYASYDLSMYPKSNDSLVRHIIAVPIEENEGLFNLEIWAGQKRMVDCNKHRISGSFTKKTVKGWGYSYYDFTVSPHQISTRMACPDTILTEKFIRSKTEHIRYNSKLPVVVYCAKGLEIEYAIWSKNKSPKKAKTE